MMKEQLAAANALILNGRLDEAAQSLALLAPKENSEWRMKAHFEAIVEFHRGNVAQSFRMMQAAAEKYGENVNLLRDLTVCQYHLQDMQGFRASLARLETRLIECEERLSPHSLLECELMAGKFLEEEARLQPAAQFYDRALKRAEKPSHRLRALIQKARWQALYEPLPELSVHYRELISVDHGRITKDLGIELEHSLMLIELRLIGSDHAWQRVQRATESRLDEIDRRLLIFDYIEGCLSQDLELPLAVLEKASEFKDLDPFETFLYNIVKETLEQQALLHRLATLAPKLPWASHLRLLCIAANLEQNSGIRQELHRKIQLIIRALDPRSQELWTNRLKQSLQTQEIRIDFSARNRSVNIQGKILDLSKKKIGLQLLEKLVAKPSLTVDEAIQLLWQSEFTPEHYHRLRMSVHRLNTLIHETAGFGKVVEVDSQNVRLRPEVRLRQAPEDGFLRDFAEGL
jgi:hypothetical protein